MTSDDAVLGETSPRAPRRRPRAASAAVALLLVGGATALAYGVSQQVPDPAAPPPAAAAPSTASAPTPPASTAATPAPAPPPEPPPPPAPAPAPAAAPAPATDPLPPPARVSIPAIGVDSVLTQVGLNPDGTLEVPQPGPDYDKAAWYEGSPVPGQVGPAVVLGHVDGRNGPSVFYRLGELGPGDTVQVTRPDGATVRFVVDSVQAFPKDAFPTDLVYGDTTRPELRLITCGGEFDRAAQSHVDNTVVFAHQV